MSKVGGRVILLIWIFLLSNIHADESTQATSEERLNTLKKRLVLLNNEIEKVEEEANRLQFEYLNFEHEYAYSNETTRTIYMEIKQLEKQLNEKRKMLLDELQKSPFFRDIGKKRTEIFSRLSKLREEAAITQSEINKLERRSVNEKNEK